MKTAKNVAELNKIHDEAMKRSFRFSLEQMEKELGPPPCEFSWFLVGSGGRREQAKISDQDHGMIFRSNHKEAEHYFLLLGKEVSKGLNILGYPYCEGNVMSSNSLWCQSEQKWIEQIQKWLSEETFDSIRYLLIFFDARKIFGTFDPLKKLKQFYFDHLAKQPSFLKRLLNNTMHVKKAIGVFHQFLPETYGPHAGAIDLKQTGLLPYVNSIRLLAIKEQITETSTLSRFEALIHQKGLGDLLSPYYQSFQELLTIHFVNSLKADRYSEVHYLFLKNVSKEEKKMLKQIFLNGKKLMNDTVTMIEKGVE